MSKHVLILAVVFVAAVLLAALIISGARCIGILFAALPARTERWTSLALRTLRYRSRTTGVGKLSKKRRRKVVVSSGGARLEEEGGAGKT
jgi:hypothetical protein